MTDRHAPWIAAAWALGVTALIAAVIWTAGTMPDRPRTPPNTYTQNKPLTQH